MVAASSPQLDLTFAALADPTRRAIIQQMANTSEDGIAVSQLAEPFMDRMSLPAVSKHLRVLERAGLLEQSKQGRVRCCHLQPEPLKAAYEWVRLYQQFWSNQLDSLATFLESQDGQEEQEQDG